MQTRDEKHTSTTQITKFLTYNIACLPSKLRIQINGNFLIENEPRVEAIVKYILEDKDQPDIICFQEAWDSQNRKYLIEKLQSSFPFNSGDLGEGFLWCKWCINAGSGLLLFSKYPILDIKFTPYLNKTFNEEMLGNKGFIAAKLKFNSDYFITVYNTHLQAGNTFLADFQKKLAGTNSSRRGEEMSLIYEDMLTWGRNSIERSSLKYLKTFLMGDLNAPLNDERRMLSISTGMSYNGYQKDDIKYPGQYSLFRLLTPNIPNNFKEVRVLPEKKGEGKIVKQDLVEAAIKENNFTGTTYDQDQLIANKQKGTTIIPQKSEWKIIDAMFASKEGSKGKLQSNIISIIDSKGYATSDHMAVKGEWSIEVEEESEWVLIPRHSCESRNPSI